MKNPKSLFKTAFFGTVLLTLWLGPSNIIGKTSIEEEKLHISLCVVVMLIIIGYRLTPKKPNCLSIQKLSQKQQKKLIKKQLNYQWHLLKEIVPFEIKTAPIKLLIGAKSSGCKTLMQNLSCLTETDLPFNCNWYHDNNSIILTIEPELIDNMPAQHCQHLFYSIRDFLNKKLKHRNLTQAYITLKIEDIMQAETSKSIDAYNYSLAALTNNKKGQTPLKVIITQCDLIAGFVPYFEHLDQLTKDNAWEIKIPNFNAVDFNESFTEMVNKLNVKMINRLHTEAQYYRRILIKDFPIQMEKLRPMILRNLQNLLKSESWPVTGITLSSATQTGNYIDLINQKLGHQPTSNKSKIMLASQRYFCDNLFYTSITNNKLSYLSLLSETWFQALAVLALFTIFMTGINAWWLQRYLEIVDFQASKLSKPKLVLEDTAGAWQRTRLKAELQPWLEKHPIPKNLSLKYDKPKDIEPKIKHSIMSIQEQCKGNLYICLRNNWQTFATEDEISFRINWLKQHQNLFKSKNFNALITTQYNIASNSIVETKIRSKIPPGQEQFWLEDLISKIENNRILLPEYKANSKNIQILLQQPKTLQRIKQLQAILKSLNDHNQAFKLLQQYEINVTNFMPKKLKKLEETALAKFKNVIRTHINAAWQESIYKFYQQKLAAKYPFKSDSTLDASIDDVKQLLNMKNFFLRYYMTPASKLGLNIQPTKLQELSAAENFLGPNMGLEYSLATNNKLNSDIEIAELNIAGNVSNLAQNQPQLFHWPLNDNDDTVSIWLKNKAGKMAMTSRHGPWGIFRLLTTTGNLTLGQQRNELIFKIGEQVVKLTVDFSRPWANISPNIPSKLL